MCCLGVNKYERPWCCSVVEVEWVVSEPSVLGPRPSLTLDYQLLPLLQVPIGMAYVQIDNEILSTGYQKKMVQPLVCKQKIVVIKGKTVWELGLGQLGFLYFK